MLVLLELSISITFGAEFLILFGFVDLDALGVPAGDGLGDGHLARFALGTRLALGDLALVCANGALQVRGPGVAP